jgi:hypothetical protein
MQELPPFENRHDYSILFADIKGFSQLKPFQQQLYLKDVLKYVAPNQQIHGGTVWWHFLVRILVQ